MRALRSTIRRHHSLLVLIAVPTPAALSLPPQNWSSQIFDVVLTLAPVGVWRVAWFVAAVLLVMSALGRLQTVAAAWAALVSVAWFWCVLWAKLTGSSIATWGGICLWLTYVAYVLLVTGVRNE